MSIFRFKPEEKEVFKISLNPERFYSTSSSGNTGSIFLNITEFSSSLGTSIVNLSDDAKGIAEYNEILKKAKNSISNNQTNIEDIISSIIEQKTTQLDKKQIPINRFSGWLPRNLISSQSVLLKLYSENLNSSYSHISDQYDSSYNNFHSLNFMSASAANDAIIYPCLNSRFSPGNGPFTFGFNIKLKDKNILEPGTVLFRSSSYAISIVTGSSKDRENLVDKYRLLLQLGNGVDVNPKDAGVLTPNCFFSDDNILSINKWHEVYIRWGSESINSRTGSFVIDNNLVGTFSFDESPIPPISEEKLGPLQNVVIVGSRYEGNNTAEPLAKFFTTQAREDFGVQNIFGISSDTEPTIYSFVNHLNAEIHDLFIKNKFIERNEISKYNSTSSFHDSNLLFYVRPNFVAEAPLQLNGESVPISPVRSMTGFSPIPFNLSFAYNFSHYLCSLENFVREDVTKSFPRLIGRFSGSINTSDLLSKSEIDIGKSLKIDYDKKFFRRNSLLLPCDHNFSVKNGLSSSINEFFTNNFNEIDTGKIFIENFLSGSNTKEPSLVSDSLSVFKIINNSETDLLQNSKFEFFVEKIDTLSFDLKNITNQDNLENETFLFNQRQEYLKIYRNIPSEFIRFHQYDHGNPLVTLFKISPLYFGNSIKKGSLELIDENFYDTNFKMVLKDNGLGGIYRADCEDPNILNKVGVIYYDDGLIVLTSPTLYYFGENGFSIQFKGESNLHILRLNVLAPGGFLNKSTNPSKNEDFALISEINLLDENLNTVMKAKLSQPVMKKIDDNINFRIKLDF
jgi:hypothetical protein